jgi:glutamate receptor, ionotropic, invertebrate
MYDAVFVIAEAFNKVLRKKPDQFRNYAIARRTATNSGNVTKSLDCNTAKGWVQPWEHGDKISRYLRKVEHEGLTGTIRFHEDGKRQNYTLHVVEMTVNSAMVCMQ